MDAERPNKMTSMQKSIKLAAILIVMIVTERSVAENLSNRRGFIYENVKILTIESGKVKLSHESGLGWVAFEDLTEESLNWLRAQAAYKDFTNQKDKERAEANKQAELARQKEIEMESLAREKADREEREKLREERDNLKKVTAEYERLSNLESLWVDDFHTLEELFDKEKIDPQSFKTFFIEALGKPDGEKVYTLPTTEFAMTRQGLREVRGIDLSITELTYNNRLKNPTTEKQEDLKLEFGFGFYRRAIASPSGHKSR